MELSYPGIEEYKTEKDVQGKPLQKAVTWSRIKARAVFVSCLNRQHVSATFRLMEENRKPLCTWKPETITWGIPGERSYFHPPDLIARTLQQLLVGDQDHPHGLVIFSGATDCAKSDTTRNFVLETLQRRLAEHPSKPLHLVTVEDPIESKWKLRLKPEDKDGISLTPETAPAYGMWFTPRALGPQGDTPSLKAAVKNALRQSPAAFYVGEVRSDADWRDVLFLAGTGHLVVTTTHAGSLSETWTRLLRATNSKTEAERAYLARTVLGVVHLVKHKTKLWVPPPPDKKGEEGMEESLPVLLPTLWRQTSASIAAFASDGVSSTQPNGDFVLARSQMVEKLHNTAKTSIESSAEGSLPLVLNKDFHLHTDNSNAVTKAALKLDWKDC